MKIKLFCYFLFMVLFSSSQAVFAVGKKGKAPVIRDDVNIYIFKIEAISADGDTFAETGFKLKNYNGIIIPLHGFFNNIASPGKDFANYKIIRITSLLTAKVLFDNGKTPCKVTAVDLYKDLCMVNFNFNGHKKDGFYSNKGFGIATKANILAPDANSDAKLITNPQHSSAEDTLFTLEANSFVQLKRIMLKNPRTRLLGVPDLHQTGFLLPVRSLMPENTGAPIISWAGDRDFVLGYVGKVSDTVENSMDKQPGYFAITIEGLKLLPYNPIMDKALTGLYVRHKGLTYQHPFENRDCPAPKMLNGDEKNKLSAEKYWQVFKEMSCYFLKQLDTGIYQNPPVTIMKTNFKLFFDLYNFAFITKGVSGTPSEYISDESRKHYPTLIKMLGLHAYMHKYYVGNKTAELPILKQFKHELDSLYYNESPTAQEKALWDNDGLTLTGKDIKRTLDFYAGWLMQQDTLQAKEAAMALTSIMDTNYMIEHTEFPDKAQTDHFTDDYNNKQLKQDSTYIASGNNADLKKEQNNLKGAVIDAMQAILARPLNEDGYSQLDSLKILSHDSHDFDTLFASLELFKTAFTNEFMYEAILKHLQMPKIQFLSADINKYDQVVEHNWRINISTGKLANDYLNIAYQPYPVSGYDPPQAIVIRDMLTSYFNHTEKLLNNLVTDLKFDIVAEGHADGLPYKRILQWYPKQFEPINVRGESIFDRKTRTKIAFTDAENAPDKNLALAYLRALFPLVPTWRKSNTHITIEAETHDSTGGDFRRIFISVKTTFNVASQQNLEAINNIKPRSKGRRGFRPTVSWMPSDLRL